MQFSIQALYCLVRVPNLVPWYDTAGDLNLVTRISSKCVYCSIRILQLYCTLGCQNFTDVGTFSFRWILPFWYFCFLFEDKARIALSSKRKQKYQNGNIHRKLKIPTSEREGKLSNPRARRARAMHGENLLKFKETRAAAPRACYAFIPT
jgi:hypothetical protein